MPPHQKKSMAASAIHFTNQNEDNQDETKMQINLLTRIFEST